MALVWKVLTNKTTGSDGVERPGPGTVYRAQIPGGWLVLCDGGGITFVPDPNHVWDGNSLP